MRLECCVALLFCVDAHAHVNNIVTVTFMFNTNPHGPRYGSVASNKPRVLLAELRRRLAPLQPPRTVRAEWIVWMDADTFVNPDDPPDLDALVRTVPESKVLLVTQTEYEAFETSLFILLLRPFEM